MFSVRYFEVKQAFCFLKNLPRMLAFTHGFASAMISGSNRESLYPQSPSLWAQNLQKQARGVLKRPAFCENKLSCLRPSERPG
jgi:hypothetical protein